MSFSLYFYIFACVWSSFYRSSGYDAFPKTPIKKNTHRHNDQTKLEDLTLTENMLFLCWMNGKYCICFCLIFVQTLKNVDVFLIKPTSLEDLEHP